MSFQDRYAVVGNPIAQSRSPDIHAAFAAACGHRLTYSRLLAPTVPGGFVQTVQAWRQEPGTGPAKGINITAPFKTDAFAYATEHSKRAQLAGAVNCIKFEGERILAENFDGIGLVRDVTHNLARAMRGARVLVLGAGGATRGVLAPFLQEQPAALVVANRTVAKAQELAQIMSPIGRIEAVGYDDLAGESFDLVFNATSSSLAAELPPIPAGVYASGTLAYDLSYGKGLTPFLAHARAAGAQQLADGVGMLVEQAAEAFAWWRGVRPATQDVIKQITVPLV
jgi:shikimate dehydrogenase